MLSIKFFASLLLIAESNSLYGGGGLLKRSSLLIESKFAMSNAVVDATLHADPEYTPDLDAHSKGIISYASV